MKRKIPFRKSWSKRNYDDETYTNFRTAVKDRDGHRCIWPNCKERKNRFLQVHHILKWSDFPHLRFNPSNGVTLCRFHHKMIKNCEQYYIRFFQDLLQLKLLEKLRTIN